MSKRDIPDYEKEKVRVLYKNGENLTSIMSIMGMGAYTIKNILGDMYSPLERRPKLTQEQLSNIYDDYIKGMKVADIARKYDRSYVNIVRAIEAKGISKSKPKEPVNVKYDINKDLDRLNIGDKIKTGNPKHPKGKVIHIFEYYLLVEYDKYRECINKYDAWDLNCRKSIV